MHGGGYTYGTLDEFEVPVRLIAERAGISTDAVGYRLAPESKYPTRNLLRDGDDARDPCITPMNAPSHTGLPPAILVTNGFDPLRDVGHAYARKLAAAVNELTYIHHPDLIPGFPQFSRSSKAAHRATLEVADRIGAAIG
ncbi:alpha/beta hydrolase [Mycobacterium servetii]|uniref:Alpha/beta hydrolase n=1 Tax=Mycobacterium servetii TaxID=3237418 RepID=A0ABV4C4P9_9MYCO